MLQYFQSRPWLVYLASLAGTVGSWLYGLPSWQQACTPQAIGSLIGNLASVTLAAAGVSIIKGLNPGGTNNQRRETR